MDPASSDRTRPGASRPNPWDPAPSASDPLGLPPLAGDAEAAARAASDSGPRLAGLSVDIFVRPRRAMRALAAEPGWRWLVPVVALVALGMAAAVAAIPATRALQRQVIVAQFDTMSARLPEGGTAGQTAEEMADMTTSGALGAAMSSAAVVGAAVGVIAAVLVVAAILHLLATLVGGQQSFTQMLTVTSWARAPLVLGAVLWLVYVVTGHYDPSPNGLSGLVAPDPLESGAEGSLLQPVLAQVELWNLWYVGLLAVAVREASRVSARKAVAVVAVVLLLEIGLGLMGVWMGRAVGGLMGG